MWKIEVRIYGMFTLTVFKKRDKVSTLCHFVDRGFQCNISYNAQIHRILPLPVLQHSALGQIPPTSLHSGGLPLAWT